MWFASPAPRCVHACCSAQVVYSAGRAIVGALAALDRALESAKVLPPLRPQRTLEQLVPDQALADECSEARAPAAWFAVLRYAALHYRHWKGRTLEQLCLTTRSATSAACRGF